jgi:hypothetical protein
MNLSKKHIENHISDLLIFQSFVNAEEIRDFQVENNQSVSEWVVKHEFSFSELTEHLLDFYSIDTTQQQTLKSILKRQTFSELVEFILAFGSTPYDELNYEKWSHDKTDLWETLLYELSNKNVETNNLQLKDDMAPLLRKNISSVVYCISLISPGNIKYFRTHKSILQKTFSWLLFISILADILFLGFGLYNIAIAVLTLSLLFIYFRLKFPEKTYINDNITFDDLINDIRSNLDKTGSVSD